MSSRQLRPLLPKSEHGTEFVGKFVVKGSETDACLCSRYRVGPPFTAQTVS